MKVKLQFIKMYNKNPKEMIGWWAVKEEHEKKLEKRADHKNSSDEIISSCVCPSKLCVELRLYFFEGACKGEIFRFVVRRRYCIGATSPYSCKLHRAKHTLWMGNLLQDFYTWPTARSRLFINQKHNFTQW